VVEVEPEASHAVTNTGVEPLWIVGLSSAAYNTGGSRRVRTHCSAQNRCSSSVTIAVGASSVGPRLLMTHITRSEITRMAYRLARLPF
jgi:hypothetical protein